MVALPEGYTVRKVKGSLKVVPMRKRAAKQEKAMPKQIEISIYPFGAYREQLWIGKVVNGEFVKESPLYKVVQAGEIFAKKTYDGKFGKSSTSEEWEITIPDDFQGALAKSRLNKDTVRIHTEYEVLHG